MLSDMTAEGYVFRTDLRLRPDASVTPVCISMAAAEQYYEAQGRTWERAAFIKARACAGDIAAGERFLKVLTPFVWRKHLDFAAIQDAARRMRDRGDGGILDRAQDALHDLVARLLLAVMDAGQHPIGLGEHFVRQVHAARFQNVALDAFQDDEFSL